MSRWHHTHTIRCSKCGKFFESGCPWRKFCPDTDCFKIWRRERWRRYKASWRALHGESVQSYNSSRLTPEQQAKRRVYDSSPERRERARFLYHARQEAAERGLSTRDIMIEWGLPPGNASRRVFLKPKANPCISTLPKNWKDTVSN